MQKDWPWEHGLDMRDRTLFIVVHHTAGPQNQDTDEIWREHINQGWNGIGYHRVIKGDGTTVQGRPDDAVGAHAQGVNYCSVGVALEGYFHPGRTDADGNPIPPDQPTEKQVTALKENLRDLMGKYPDARIIGHRYVAKLCKNPDYATACPGDVLYGLLPGIIASLAQVKEEQTMDIGCLSAKYEGGGPATISTGDGDSGGISYGTYQLATSVGTVAEFVEWLQARTDCYRGYGDLLAKHDPGTREFSADWLYLAKTDEQGFGQMQTEFVMPQYFDPAMAVLTERGIDNVPDAVKAVLFSNAIQHGPETAGELVADSYDPDPVAWITRVYDTKINDPDWSSGAPSLRPGLFRRWENEKQDAIALL